MTVNLTRIYTKLGDAGQTHLGDMSRVSKLDPRVEAYGTVDELNATIGLALLASGVPKRVSEWLRRIQNDLLDLGADLCVPPAKGEGLGGFEGATEGEKGAAAEVDASTKRSVREPSETAAAETDVSTKRSVREPSEAAAAETDVSTKRSVREKPARSRLRITPDYVEWPRAGMRRDEREAATFALVRDPRRDGGLREAAHLQDGVPARGAAVARGERCESGSCALPEQALRPAVHPR